ncbi:hypothetical protein HND97_12515 [Vibrio cholerae]|nr:hypothetical protein HND97_12515 [Vibrio cholerae]
MPECQCGTTIQCMLAVIKFKTNTAYQARYWTQGNDPVSHSGQWDAWQILGQCDGG